MFILAAFIMSVTLCTVQQNWEVLRGDKSVQMMHQCNVGVGPEIACFVYGLKFLIPTVSLKDWPLFDLGRCKAMPTTCDLRPAGVTFNSQIKVSLQVDILAGSVTCGFGPYIENPCMIIMITKKTTSHSHPQYIAGMSCMNS